MVITQAELLTMARERFGDDPNRYAFVCPTCGDVASKQDYLDAGLPGVELVGQQCIGRILREFNRPSDRGCNTAAYGLIHGPWQVIVPRTSTFPPAAGSEPDTTIIYSFEMAPAPGAPGV